MATQKIVVIGNGMVGHHYVEQLLAANLDAEITVLGAESRPAYDRVHLSEFFAGKKPEDLALTTREYYAEQGVKAHFGDEVTGIRREDKVVVTRSGREFPWDKLVLATGSYPFVPPIPGSERKGCLTYRTIDDLGEIRAEAQSSKVGVVVGGGLLGLECANALRNLGLETHVVEFAPGGGTAGRIRQSDAAAQGGSAGRARPYRQGDEGDRCRRRPSDAHEFRRGRLPGNGHDRVLRRDPALRSARS